MQDESTKNIHMVALALAMREQNEALRLLNERVSLQNDRIAELEQSSNSLCNRLLERVEALHNDIKALSKLDEEIYKEYEARIQALEQTHRQLNRYIEQQEDRNNFFHKRIIELEGIVGKLNK